MSAGVGPHHADEGRHDDLPPDLLRALRDQSVIVPQDQAVWELIAKWQNAPCDTASALPRPESSA